MNLVGVPPKDVDLVWPEVETMIANTLKRFGDDRWTTEDIKAWVADGSMQLWTDSDRLGVCLTQVQEYPGVKELTIWLVATVSGYRHEHHMRLFEQICQGATKIGCKRVRAYCRPGFEKLLTGWRKQRVELAKEL